MIDDFKYDMSHAILSLFPDGASFVLEGFDYESLTWTDERPKPTKIELETEIARLQAEYDTQDYARNREAEYPDLADQLDYIFHNGITKWKSDMIQPVKDKYPKG